MQQNKMTGQVYALNTDDCIISLRNNFPDFRGLSRNKLVNFAFYAFCKMYGCDLRLILRNDHEKEQSLKIIHDIDRRVYQMLLNSVSKDSSLPKSDKGADITFCYDGKFVSLNLPLRDGFFTVEKLYNPRIT